MRDYGTQKGGYFQDKEGLLGMDMGFDFLTCKSVIKLLWVWSLRTSFCYMFLSF